ncbi:MAG TPA: aldo/keto reductase [Acidobacteriota bacterium]|nr:aldo/keto reductase [Acidobacteriota bacterium]
MKNIKLNNGVQMPQLGLGTWQASDHEIEQSLVWAFEEGYRHIDTAKIYGNEEAIGRAIKKSGIPRSELFITTKLWNSDHGNVKKAFETSLKKLGVEYVDLYLMHWPVAERNQSWKVLEEIYKSGKAKSIGVSNFTVKHLQELLKTATVVPAVNQFELTPYLYDKALCDFCHKKGIAVESYSPLTRGEKLDDKKLVAIAHKYGKTTAQILIRWCIEHGFIVIPKSTSKKRLNENISVFDFTISAEDMRTLDGFNEDFRTCWDPNSMP